MREVKRKHVEDATIDQHVLAVITDKVVGGTGHNDSGSKKAEFQLAKVLGATTVGIYDQGSDSYAPFRGCLQCRLHVFAVKSKDRNLNGFFRVLDGSEQGRCSVNGLNDQLHESRSSPMVIAHSVLRSSSAQSALRS